MDNLPSILTPDLGLLFWMLITFLVVLFCLARFGFPSITKMVDDRKKYIDESLSKAHEASERLQHIKEEGEALLAQARDQQAKIIKDATSTRDAILDEAKAKAQTESGRMIAEAKKQIEIEKESAVRDIRAQVAQLSVEIAEKIVREHLSSDKAHMEFIDRLLDDVSKKK